MRKPGWQEYHDSIRESQFCVTDLVRCLGIWHCLGVSVTLSLCMKIHLQPTDEEDLMCGKSCTRKGYVTSLVVQ